MNNRNKLIGSEGWSQIADKMEDFKLLKELILNVTNDDLPILADIFEKKTHALRQVETFHLTVTDQI